MVGLTGSNHFSSGDLGLEVDNGGGGLNVSVHSKKGNEAQTSSSGNNTDKRKELSSGRKAGMVKNFGDGSRRFLRRVSLAGAAGVSQLGNFEDKDDSQNNDENNNDNPDNPEGGEDNESIDNESQHSSSLIRKFKYDVFSAHRKTRKTNLSIWHSPEFLKYFGGHFGGDSKSSFHHSLTLIKSSNHSVASGHNNKGLKDSQKSGASGGSGHDSRNSIIDVNQDYGLGDSNRGEEEDNVSRRNSMGDERTQQQLVEEKVAKVMKNPLLRPIMNNKKEFDRLELNRDFVGCYLPDLALALRDNTSIRHVFILEGWLVTLSVKKAKILLGIIGSIPKLRTMSIRFPTKKFYFPVSTLIHLMSPATKLRRLKLWGIKIPRRRDVTMLSNTLTLLHQLEEFWIFAKGDVNLNPLIKALTNLRNLEMVYINQCQNTKYLQGGNYLADLCSPPSSGNNTSTYMPPLVRSHTMSNHGGGLRASAGDFSGVGLSSIAVNLGADNTSVGDSGARAQLTGLSVTNILMVNAQMEALFTTLSNTSSPSPLLWLSLIDVTLRGNSVKVALADMLTNNTTLQILTLHNVGLDDDDCALIADAMTIKDPTATSHSKSKKGKRKVKRRTSTDNTKSLSTYFGSVHGETTNPAVYGVNDAASVTSELTSTYSTCSEQQGADISQQQQQQQPLLPHLTNGGDMGYNTSKIIDDTQSQQSSQRPTRLSAAAVGAPAIRKKSALCKLDIRKNDRISSQGYGAFINMIQKNSVFAIHYGVTPPLREILTDSTPEIKQVFEQLLNHLQNLQHSAVPPPPALTSRPSYGSYQRVSKADRDSGYNKTM